MLRMASESDTPSIPSSQPPATTFLPRTVVDFGAILALARSSDSIPNWKLGVLDPDEI